MPTCLMGMQKIRMRFILAREHVHTSGSITTGNRLNQAFFLEGNVRWRCFGGIDSYW
mgnify:CR=1 FL=1